MFLLASMETNLENASLTYKICTKSLLKVLLMFKFECA